MNNELMIVKFSHEDRGFCRVYYRVVSMNGKKLDYRLYCCKQEEGHDQFIWYACPGEILEPSSEIRQTIEITNAEGTVLRARLPVINPGIKALWFELGDVCINDEGQIDQDWKHFEKGTDRFEIWHWFEETFNVSVIDLQSIRGDV